MQQFYMDDFMQSYHSEEEARRSADEIKTVLHTGGFNLTEILSKKPAALENLLEEDKAEMKVQRIVGQTLDPKFFIPKVDVCISKASLHRTHSPRKH